MCQSIAEGGLRCAAHTRPRYQAALFGTPEWDEAAAAYASTPTGRMELQTSLAASEAAGDITSAVAFEHALTGGQRLREKAEGFRAELNNRAAFVAEPQPESEPVPPVLDFPEDRYDDSEDYYDGDRYNEDGDSYDEAYDPTPWSPSMSGYTWDQASPAFRGCTTEMTCDQFIDRVCANSDVTRAEFETAAAEYLAQRRPVDLVLSAGSSTNGTYALDNLTPVALRGLVGSGAAVRFTPQQIREIAELARERRVADEEARAAQEAARRVAEAEQAGDPATQTSEVATSPRRGRRNAPEVPNDPTELAALSTDSDAAVRAAVAAHENTPAEVLARLATADPKVEVRAAAARNENTPTDTVTGLVADRSIKVRAGAARNPNMPVQHLRTLAQDANDSVKGAVARNPSTPPDVYSALVSDPAAGVRKHAALRREIPAEHVATLARDTNQQVRSALARNRSTGIQTLRALCRDEAQSVRASAVRNPNFPASLLRGRVARDTAPGVRAEVARNERTPTATIARLANDPDPWVRRNVTWNATTPAVVLYQLLDDPDDGVRTSARTRREDSPSA